MTAVAVMLPRRRWHYCVNFSLRARALLDMFACCSGFLIFFSLLVNRTTYNSIQFAALDGREGPRLIFLLYATRAAAYACRASFFDWRKRARRALSYYC